jgi:hypothetical protein
MIKIFILMKHEISLYSIETEKTRSLNLTQFSNVDRLILSFDPFEEMTQRLTSEKSTISMVIPAIKALKLSISSRACASEITLQIKITLLNSIEIRFGSIRRELNYTVATFLDPRFKLRYLDHSIYTER